jgi:hypothetical protein
MQRAVVIRGRLVGPTTAELDERVPDPEMVGTVEVLLRIPASMVPDETESIVEFLESLPAGVRSKVEIDRQLDDERAAWDRS